MQIETKLIVVKTKLSYFLGFREVCHEQDSGVDELSLVLLHSLKCQRPSQYSFSANIWLRRRWTCGPVAQRDYLCKIFSAKPSKSSRHLGKVCRRARSILVQACGAFESLNNIWLLPPANTLNFSAAKIIACLEVWPSSAVCTSGPPATSSFPLITLCKICRISQNCCRCCCCCRRHCFWCCICSCFSLP